MTCYTCHHAKDAYGCTNHTCPEYERRPRSNGNLFPPTRPTPANYGVSPRAQTYDGGTDSKEALASEVVTLRESVARMTTRLDLLERSLLQLAAEVRR